MPGPKGRGSDRQLGPALGTTGIDDATAIFGCHAGTETMGTLTFQGAGLEGSFHDSSLLTVFSNKFTPLAGAKRAQRLHFSSTRCQEYIDSMTWHQGVDNFFRQV